MSFEIQALPDIIRVIALLSLSRESQLEKNSLKHEIYRDCAGLVCVETSDFDKALKRMSNEGLVIEEASRIKLTERVFN